MDKLLKVEDCFKYKKPPILSSEKGGKESPNRPITVREYEVLREFIVNSINDVINLLIIHQDKTYRNENNLLKAFDDIVEISSSMNELVVPKGNEIKPEEPEKPVDPFFPQVAFPQVAIVSNDLIIPKEENNP